MSCYFLSQFDLPIGHINIVDKRLESQRGIAYEIETISNPITIGLGRGTPGRARAIPNNITGTIRRKN